MDVFCGEILVAFEEKKVDFTLVVYKYHRSFKNHIILAALFTNKTALLYEYGSKWSVVLICRANATTCAL